MDIIKMNQELAIQNLSVLSNLYFQNALECSYMSSFELKEAENKIHELIEHIKTQTAICYGLFDNNTLVGYIWAYQHSFREELRVYINEIRILEDYRGKGFGAKLIKTVEKEAMNAGIKAVYIHAEATNHNAIRLYKRLGFEPERIQLRKGIVEGKHEH